MLPRTGVPLPRIILVLDEPERATRMRNHFVLKGYSVALAEDRETALSLLATQSFAVLIADVQITGAPTDGAWRVVRAARQANADAVVIFLTPRRTEDIERKARQSGVDLLLQRPQPLTEIERAVRLFLANGSAPEPRHA
jgi:DNA-binding response OmpR family regulator